MQERTVSEWTDGWINGCIQGNFNPLIDFIIDDKWTKPHCEISAVVMNEAFLVYFNTDLIKKQWVTPHNCFLYSIIRVDSTPPREIPVISDGRIIIVINDLHKLYKVFEIC